MPLTILPGIIQFARSPVSETCIAPRIDRSMWPPRIIANESALSKNAAPGTRGDGLLAGVDEIGVDLVLGRERPDAEQAVLALQPDVHAGRDVVGDERRHADAEVDVEAVAQLLRRARGHLFAVPGHG